MPIELSTPISAVSQDEFHAIDKVMLGLAFEIHNEFGPLLDENIYKTELANRCLMQGIDARREVLLRVRHQGFIKDYFIDLLLGGSTITEAKTVKKLTEVHRSQGINYLLLAGTNHGSLVNFRPCRVQREFLSNRLAPATRTKFQVDTRDWPRDDDHDRLQEVVTTFCAEMGVGLDLLLFREAFASLMGLGDKKPVPLFSGTRPIGQHELHLLNPETGLAVTSLSNTTAYRLHLRRFLNITPLSGIAWVNLRLGQIEFTHLERQNHGG